MCDTKVVTECVVLLRIGWEDVVANRQIKRDSAGFCEL